MAELIAYFSRNGNNYLNGTIQNLKIGNTEIAVEIIYKITGADIFKINPLVPYSSDYSECIEESKEDLRRNARPELKTYLADIDKYNTIYLCYPNYWGTMPMPVFTFLEKYNFSGKTIKPLCTHEGSNMGNSEDDIKKLCPNSKIEKGLAVLGYKVKDSEKAIKKWIY